MLLKRLLRISLLILFVLQAYLWVSFFTTQTDTDLEVTNHFCPLPTPKSSQEGPPFP